MCPTNDVEEGPLFPTISKNRAQLLYIKRATPKSTVPRCLAAIRQKRGGAQSGEARRVAWGSIYHGKAGVQLAVHAAALALLEVAPICLMLVPPVGLGNLWPSSVGNNSLLLPLSMER
jgi:hypothetical protein